MNSEFWKIEDLYKWEKSRKVKLNPAQRQYIVCMLFERLKDRVDHGVILSDSLADLDGKYIKKQFDELCVLLPIELSDEWTPEHIYKEHPNVFPSSAVDNHVVK